MAIDSPTVTYRVQLIKCFFSSIALHTTATGHYKNMASSSRGSCIFTSTITIPTVLTVWSYHNDETTAKYSPTPVILVTNVLTRVSMYSHYRTVSVSAIYDCWFVWRNRHIKRYKTAQHKHNSNILYQTPATHLSVFTP